MLATLTCSMWKNPLAVRGSVSAICSVRLLWPSPWRPAARSWRCSQCKAGRACRWCGSAHPALRPTARVVVEPRTAFANKPPARGTRLRANLTAPAPSREHLKNIIAKHMPAPRAVPAKHQCLPNGDPKRPAAKRLAAHADVKLPPPLHPASPPVLPHA